MKNSLLILLLVSLHISAQKEATFWYFGENAGLDFSTNPPTSLNNGQINTFEGCSSISDKNGNLLFYSDGLSVWNKENNLMNFSDGTVAFNNLLGNPSSTQSGLIVPKPESESIYYLFTVDDGPLVDFDLGVILEDGNGLNVYTIDISKNNGLGEIINGPVNLSTGAGNEWSEKVTAVAGKECNTIWLISASSENYYSFKIDSGGIDTSNPTITDIPFRNNRRGYLKVSPDGTTLVEANQGRRSETKIYDFNNETGKITNERTLNLIGEGYGVEFSPSSKKLYISTGEFSQNDNEASTVFIFQYDLSSSDINTINSSRETIYRGIGFRGALQLGIDRKIYYAKSRQTSLGVINFPENSGENANYVDDGISLGQNRATEGLPPFIQSFFASVNLIDKNNTNTILSGKIQELCEDDILEIKPELDFSTFIVERLSWTKQDDTSVNVSTENISIDNNLGSGVYIFEATATDDCGRLQVYSSSIEVVFNEKPIANSVFYEECDFDENPMDFITNFKLSSRENQVYTGVENVTIDFFEISDTTFSSPLNKEEYRNSSSTQIANHKLIARVTNEKGCTETTTIELKVNASGLTSYKDIYLCELDDNSSTLKSNGTGKSSFNFDNKTTQIILASNGVLNENDYVFDYFLTRDDARNRQNKIEPLFKGLYENNTDIFVRVSFKASGNCESIGQFKIFVRELPTPQGNTAPILLCVSNPIISPQPNTVTLNADTGFPSDTYVWYLNDKEIIGQTAAFLEVNTTGNYKVEAFRVYENNITNIEDNIVCVGYNTFSVFTSNEPIIEDISFLDNQDDFKDNSITVKVTGIGNYEYAINSTSNIDFDKQEENLSYTFSSVPAGLNVSI